MKTPASRDFADHHEAFIAAHHAGNAPSCLTAISLYHTWHAPNTGAGKLLVIAARAPSQTRVPTQSCTLKIMAHLPREFPLNDVSSAIIQSANIFDTPLLDEGMNGIGQVIHVSMGMINCIYPVVAPWSCGDAS